METVLIVENKIRDTSTEVHLSPSGKFILHRKDLKTGKWESGIATPELSAVIRNHLL